MPPVKNFRQWLKKRRRPANRGSGTDKALSSLLLSSALGILACCFCLAGATWAWFSESMTSDVDDIKSSSYSVSVNIVEAETETDAVVVTESAAPEESIVSEPAAEEPAASTPEAVETPAAESEVPAAAASESPAEESAAPAENTETAAEAPAETAAEAPAVAAAAESETPSIQIIGGNYVLAAGKKYTVTLTASGSAATGFCKVTLNSRDAYSIQFGAGEILTFTLDCTSASGTVQVSFTPCWGTYSGYLTSDLIVRGGEVSP